MLRILHLIRHLIGATFPSRGRLKLHTPLTRERNGYREVNEMSGFPAPRAPVNTVA